MKALIQLILIIAVVLGSVFGRRFLIEHQPKLISTPVSVHLPLVRCVPVESSRGPLVLNLSGTISAPRRFELAPEVSGKATDIQPKFLEGGCLTKGQWMIRIDPRDARLAVSAAKANLQADQAGLQLERATAELKIADWKELNTGEAPLLVRRSPQITLAEAHVARSRVALSQAELRLERTEIRMPIDGKIVSRHVEVGQRVNTGSPIAVIEPSAAFEARIRIPLYQLALLGVKPNGQGLKQLTIQVNTKISAAPETWNARPERLVPEISSTDPMATLIASILPNNTTAEEPVAGQFVFAEVSGPIREFIRVPASCVGVDDQVLVVDDGQRLARRGVRILQRTAEIALVDHGLLPGELLVLTPPPVIVDGMQVHVESTSTEEH